MSKRNEVRRRRNERRLADARQQVFDAAGAIIGAIIDGAKGGNYLQAKFLFDFAGVPGGAEETPAPSLAETLLAALRPAGDKNPAAAEDSATAAR